VTGTTGIFRTPIAAIGLVVFVHALSVVSFPPFFGHPAFRTCFFRHILSPLKKFDSLPNLFEQESLHRTDETHPTAPPIEVEVNLSGSYIFRQIKRDGRWLISRSRGDAAVTGLTPAKQ
jgi:hypothetical protein